MNKVGVLVGLVALGLVVMWVFSTPTQDSGDNVAASRPDPAVCESEGTGGASADTDAGMDQRAALQEENAVEVIELEADRVARLRREIYSGSLTREVDEAEYERAQREVAKATISAVNEDDVYVRAAKIAGAKSWRALEEMAAEFESSDPYRHHELVSIMQDSLAASELVNETASSLWESTNFIEEWRSEDGSHRMQDWAQGRDLPPTALHRFSAAVQVGDSNFRVHYNSSHFPQVEAAVVNVRSRLAALDE